MSDFAKFEAAGEEAVRRNLALGRYGEVNGRQARLWLDQIERDRDLKESEQSAELTQEKLAIAREARDASLRSASAAEASANEAQKANIVSTLALTFSVIAIAVSILSAFLK